MAEYINRQAVLDLLWKDGRITTAGIKEIPAADVAPVVHGRWIVAHGNPTPYCSKCRKEAIRTFLGGYAYLEHCPRCGAKMQGEVNE